MLISGFALSAAFMLLVGMGSFLSGSGTLGYYEKAILVEAVAFLGPMIIVMALKRPMSLSITMRMKRFPFSALGFTLCFAFAVSLISFLINYGMDALWTNVTGGKIGEAAASAAAAPGANTWLVFIAMALVPAIVEELFMRGIIFSSYEKCGTVGAIILSSLIFAMIHVSGYNFLGPMIAGLAYAYLTYTLDSVWPAVIAHLFNNSYILLMSWLMTTYSAFGLWPYFLAVNILLFLLFLYISLAMLQKLVRKGKIKKLQRADKMFLNIQQGTMFSPGFVLFVMLFIAKIAFGMFGE